LLFSVFKIITKVGVLQTHFHQSLIKGDAPGGWTFLTCPVMSKEPFSERSIGAGG
jgi:hypothetical protein